LESVQAAKIQVGAGAHAVLLQALVESFEKQKLGGKREN
jgi:hypothetical protein